MTTNKDARQGDGSLSVSRGVQYIFNASGTRLGLTCFPAEGSLAPSDDSQGVVDDVSASRTPIVLAHGTFSNHRSCRGVAQYLSKRGFDCWILDFQGHGKSDLPSIEPDFESMCLEDTDAVLTAIRHLYPNSKIHWVGHSGGGLAALMYFSRYPEKQAFMGKFVSLASQATFAAKKPLNRWAIQASNIVTKLLRVAPGKWFKIGPENEFAPVMQQWYRWSLEQRWTGTDGFDYENALQSFTLPWQCFAGKGDTFIAPVAGCRHLFECAGSAEKEFHFCSISTGFREDYTHPRIVSSSGAAKDIWPMIADWLQSPR